jgi:hypothetical protein
LFYIYVKPKRTLTMVLMVTGTNFPAVRVISLLVADIINLMHFWKGMGAPIQSHPKAAYFTLSA